jgi:hypothetical protein
MTKSEAVAKPTKSAKALYRDGPPQDVIQHLDAKLILKPVPFTSVESFREFGRMVEKTTKQFEIDSREDVHENAKKRVEGYFLALQQAAKNWIALGRTKTGMVYRLKGNELQSHE